VWAPVVIKAHPVSDHTAGELQGLEAMAMYALLFERADQALHHAVLLGAVRRDEFLAQSVASDQRGVAVAGEDKTV